MVSTITLPVRNGSPVQVRYPLRDPATYAFPHLMFILRLMIPKSIILLALWTACAAFGNTIIVTGIDSAMGIQSISMDENGSATPIYWSGAIDINVNGYIRQVFCVQLFTDIYLNTTYDTVMDYSDTANLKRVGWLLQNEFPPRHFIPAQPCKQPARPSNSPSGTSSRTTAMDLRPAPASSPNPPTPATPPTLPS